MTTYRYATDHGRAEQAAPPCDACGQRPARHLEIIVDTFGAAADREGRICDDCCTADSLSRRPLGLQDLDDVTNRPAWIEDRSAALAELGRLTRIAREHAASSPEWLDVFETLSSLSTRYCLDHANVCAARPVWHLPDHWVEVNGRTPTSVSPTARH